MKRRTLNYIAMKRRQLLQFLALPLFLVGSCKEKLPTSPTIVTGKIIDEKGLPLEGAGLRLSGTDVKGFAGTTTFSITTESDKDGNYKLSQIIPKNTDHISILSRPTDKVPTGNQGYAPHISRNNSFVLETAPRDIARENWGKTTTLNYQFIKQ
ncbi:carboxypeptidase-like regulatory domain-containing protein [Dyadobacter tibetensis]|uniref:carboxypeptidase-like regulatory domain-containing protein n=1 Tax=Dyadobacter tibetensis TaxID=1211851 RepID=UPI00047126CE|nr:carboxypeptidase-like regulatory domain-containing protein [Dyadobacter tibetensis]